MMPKLRENRVKRSMERGEVDRVASGPRTPYLADSFGPPGYNGVSIEAEHCCIDIADIPDPNGAANLWGMTSVVRVNRNVPGISCRTIGIGAQGVGVSHVNTDDEARAAVDAGKVTPIGHRVIDISSRGLGMSDFLTRATVAAGRAH